MKAKLTLLAVALMTVCAYAANVWRAAEDTPTAAGTALVDDDLLTAKTVFETTLKNVPVTIAGEEFTLFIQVRNDANPSADNPNGTEKAGSTSITLNVKKDLTLTIFYRRQSTAQEETGGVYASNDGKDLKIFNQTDFTVLDGELVIDHETEDFKYAYVSKTYQLTAGVDYVISARGTTIQYYGMNYEAVEVVPTIGPAISLSMESGKDISAELATALESNPMPESIAITLAAGGSYTISSAITTAAPLTITGDEAEPATIDASALAGPMVAISTTPYESTLDANGFYVMGDIAFSNLTIKGLPAQLIYGNKIKALIGKLSTSNCIIEVASGNKTVYDFNGGGVVGTLSIVNSTIYGNPQHTGQLYSSQSGQKATEAGLEMQQFSLLNSTFYNIAYDKNVNTHRQANQKWMGYEVKNCLVVDCGKSGQFIRGLNGGQNGGNPVWAIEGNAFQRIVDGAFTDVSADENTNDEAEPVKDNVEGVVVFAADYANGDFTLGACPQNTAKVGDPRWLNDTPAPIYIETDMTSQFSSLTNWTNWVGATGYATWAAPQVVTNAGETVYMCEKYEETSNSTGDVFYQELKGLASGTYKIELYGSAAFTFGRGIGSGIFADDDTAEGPITENTGVSLYAQTSNGTVSQEIAVYKATSFGEVSTAVLENVIVGEDGNLKLGMDKTTNYTNWHIVQLKGVTAMVNAVELWSTLTAEANALAEQPMNANVLAQLQAAMVDASGFTTAEEYKTAIDNLQASIKAANASVKVYKSVKEALDTYAAKAATLDDAGQAAYDVAEIQKAYDERTLESDDCLASIKAAYIAAVKAQTTPGADFTDVAGKLQSDWIGATGVYNTDYAERFGDEMPIGDIMYQTIEGLKEGTYKVELYAVASQAWNAAAVGANITEAYANDGVYALEVIAQTACDPTQSVATMEANVGSDGKLQMGMRNIAAGGNWFVIQVKSISLVALKPEVGPAIALNIESGKDISAELAAALENNPMPESIAITLAAGGSYTISSAITTAAPLTITGDEANPATIDASALAGPMVAISTTPYESTLDANGFYVMGDIAFSNLTIKGLPAQLIYGNKVKALIGKLSTSNCIIEVASGNKTVYDFNGGGVVGTLSIVNSTIYGNPQHTGQLYSSQSGQKATEAGLEMQQFSLLNSTFYNIAYDKNVNTHRQANQKWMGYEVKNCLVVDCGKSGQFIRGLNGGQNGGNPVWAIEGNAFQRIVDGAFTDVSANESTNDEAEPVKDNVEGVVVFAADYVNGDFSLGNCPQNTAKVGDPRWLDDTNYYQFVASEWPAGDVGRISPDNVVVDETANTITVSQTGQNNVALIFRSANVYTVPAADHYFVIKATGLSVNDGDSYLWWLNNTNDGGSYKPSAIYEEDGQTVFAWDINMINIGGQLGVADAEFKDEGGWSTTFGMTLADANVPAVFSYIGFTDQIAEPVDEAEYAWDATLWVAGDPGRISPDKVVTDEVANTITVSQTGDNNVALLYKTDKVLYVTGAKYFVIQGKGLSTAETKSYLWWLNNTNNGSQVIPTYAVEDAEGLVSLIWNIADSGLGASFEAPKTYLVGNATWNTTFGLTLADETVPAVISYIGYEGEDSQIVKDAKALFEGIGQIRINGIENGAVYNLNGQKVNNPSKGIYIINGKKVVLK